MEVKITKRELIEETINSMVANHFWMVHGKIYDSPEKKYSRKFKFIVWLDLTYDLWDEETGEDRSEREVLEDIIDSYCDLIPWGKNFFDNDSFSDFYEACNDTIIRYNDMNKPLWAR